ncbi:hypothetical protein B566_EDAN007829 [Ephemera danica]|nr:hypothetical protein B566_EDAN007829 [Ephemera danica]
MDSLDNSKKPVDDATIKGACLVECNSAPGGLQLVNPKAVSRRSPGDLVSLAQEIQKADVVVHASATAKLELILAQVRHLQEMARKVILEAKESADLHHAACNFRKVPGFIYHLYRRDSGQLYFSMLSPRLL